MIDLNPRNLRDVLGTFLTGVTVITTVDNEGRPHGVTANSFSSVSLDPPLVLWSQATAARSFPAFQESTRFVVNILAENQIDISTRFSKSGEDKFADVPVTLGLGGVPMIDGCVAHLECSKFAAYPGGDHVVFIGHVERMQKREARPLAFGGGRYMVAYAHDLGERSVDIALASARHLDAVKLCSNALPELCASFGYTTSLAVWGNHGPTVIRWEASRQPVSDHLRTGVVLNATRSAAGILFSALLPREVTAPIIEQTLERDAAQGQARERYELEAELAAVRARGMARSAVAHSSALHKASVTSFSAPVLDADGMLALSLTITARADALEPDWDGEAPRRLRAAAQALSARLGYMPAARMATESTPT